MVATSETSDSPTASTADPNSPAETDFIHADLETILHDAGLQSWVSLSNQVAIVTVLSETKLPEPPAAAETNALVGRVLQLSLDESLWVPPSHASSRAEPEQQAAALIAQGNEFTMSALGWTYSEGMLLRFAAYNAVRLEVGGTYITPLVQYQDSAEGWGVLTPWSVMPLKGSQVAEQDAMDHQAGNATTALLQDLDVEQLKQILADAPMHPNADTCRALPGAQRPDCLSSL